MYVGQSYYRLARCPSGPTSWSFSMATLQYMYISLEALWTTQNNSYVVRFIGCIEMAWLFETHFLSDVRIST